MRRTHRGRQSSRKSFPRRPSPTFGSDFDFDHASAWQSEGKKNFVAVAVTTSVLPVTPSSKIYTLPLTRAALFLIMV